MSVSYDLYNADEEFADMSKWECDHRHPIGAPDNVMDSLNRLFHPRRLNWTYSPSHSSTDAYNGCYSGLADRNCEGGNEYVELYLTVNKEGYVCEISSRKGSASLLRLLMEQFGLKYAFSIDVGGLIDPYKYTGDWKSMEG